MLPRFALSDQSTVLLHHGFLCACVSSCALRLGHGMDALHVVEHFRRPCSFIICVSCFYASSYALHLGHGVGTCHVVEQSTRVCREASTSAGAVCIAMIGVRDLSLNYCTRGHGAWYITVVFITPDGLCGLCACVLIDSL